MKLSSLRKHHSVTLVTHCTYLQLLTNGAAYSLLTCRTLLLTHLFIAVNRSKNSQENFWATLDRPNSFSDVVGVLLN